MQRNGNTCLLYIFLVFFRLKIISVFPQRQVSERDKRVAAASGVMQSLRGGAYVEQGLLYRQRQPAGRARTSLWRNTRRLPSVVTMATVTIARPSPATAPHHTGWERDDCSRAFLRSTLPLPCPYVWLPLTTTADDTTTTYRSLHGSATSERNSTLKTILNQKQSWQGRNLHCEILK